MKSIPNSDNLTIEKKFGASMRHFRILKKLSQEELAFRSGLNRNYISDTERGTRNVSLRSIAKISHGLGISIADLFKNID